MNEQKEKTVKQVNRVKELMKVHGITQTQLAVELGQSRINFNKVVNNKRSLDIPTAKKISKMFDRQWFEMYEPIDMELTVHGSIDFMSNPRDVTVKLYDPIEDDPMQIRLKNYLSNKEDLICIFDGNSNSVWLMEKKKKCKTPEIRGLHYAKYTDGKIGFIHYGEEKRLRLFNPTLEWHKKKLNPKTKFEYTIPVSRIDYCWERLDKNKPIKRL